MEQTVVRVICAIGQSGQLGLDGVLPWEGNPSPEYVADVARFFASGMLINAMTALDEPFEMIRNLEVTPEDEL